jgi:hypothetical protein
MAKLNLALSGVPRWMERGEILLHLQKSFFNFPVLLIFDHDHDGGGGAKWQRRDGTARIEDIQRAAAS